MEAAGFLQAGEEMCLQEAPQQPEERLLREVLRQKQLRDHRRHPHPPH